MTMRLGPIAVALAFIFLIAASQASHAAIFIKIDGIDGESTVQGHQNWIDVISVSWGNSRAPIGAAGGVSAPRGAGSITLVRSIDKASPLLQQACADGKAATGGVTLHVVETGGQNTEYILEGVVFRTYTTQRSARPMESVTLNFSNIRTSARPQRGTTTLTPAR